MKLATWNVNSLKVRLPQVLAWLDLHQPDVLALQETKTTDDKFPLTEIEAAGYKVIYAGQKTFNGVAIISRKKADDIIVDIPQLIDPQRRILAATVDGIRILNLYVPNGESITSDKYQYKLNWLTQIKNYIQQQLIQYPKLIVMGDFNIAPEARDVHNPDLWQDRVLCSEPERQAFCDLLQIGLHDTFRLFTEESANYTWWDYRSGSFHRNWGLRIDHILTSNLLVKSCDSCVIDKKPRQNERPSDHTPLIATFA